jgi:hypothetical protein
MSEETFQTGSDVALAHAIRNASGRSVGRHDVPDGLGVGRERGPIVRIPTMEVRHARSLASRATAIQIADIPPRSKTAY